MDTDELLTGRFQAHQGHLRAVALRMLGSAAEADDAVQETWLRLRRSDVADVANLGGWLTTVLARVALNMLRARGTRRELPIDERIHDAGGGPDPEGEALAADAVGPALLVVLDTLGPAERLAFVLHDLFGMSFDEIAPIVERTPAASRQLASRARRRVRGGEPDAEADPARRREVVDAFLAASRDGDFGALLTVLDPDVVLRADAAAVDLVAANTGRGAPDLAAEVRGADAVARVFAGRARAARTALVDGVAAAVFAVGGRIRSVFRVVVVHGRIVEIEVVADPDTIAALEVRPVDA